MNSAHADVCPLGLPEVEAVDALPPEALPGFALQLAALQARVAARMVVFATGETRRPTVVGGDNDRHLTAGQVAALLCVPEQHIYALIRRGNFPVVRFGKYVRVPLDDLRKWLLQHHDRRVDGVIGVTYSPDHDRQRSKAAP